jgi:hypothetical protein
MSNQVEQCLSLSVCREDRVVTDLAKNTIIVMVTLATQMCQMRHTEAIVIYWLATF